MKTSPKHQPTNETQQLFRELFNLQFRLEHYLDDYDPKKRLIIQLIDDIMERMLNDSMD